VYINYLRKKLAMAHPAGQASSPVIETVRGQGYRLCGGDGAAVEMATRLPAARVVASMAGGKAIEVLKRAECA
jgi:Transcriptional regulatory protein, C terminal